MKLRTFTTPFFPLYDALSSRDHGRRIVGWTISGHTTLTLSPLFFFQPTPQKTPSIFFDLSFFVCFSSSFSARAIKDIKLIPALLPLVNAGFTKSAEIQNVDCYISPNRTFTINSIGEFVFMCLWSNVVLLAFKRSVFPDKCGWEGLC